MKNVDGPNQYFAHNIHTYTYTLPGSGIAVYTRIGIRDRDTCIHVQMYTHAYIILMVGEHLMPMNMIIPFKPQALPTPVSIKKRLPASIIIPEQCGDTWQVVYFIQFLEGPFVTCDLIHNSKWISCTFIHVHSSCRWVSNKSVFTERESEVCATKFVDGPKQHSVHNIYTHTYTLYLYNGLIFSQIPNNRTPTGSCRCQNMLHLQCTRIHVHTRTCTMYKLVHSTCTCNNYSSKARQMESLKTVS